MLPIDIRDLKPHSSASFGSDGRFPDYVRRIFDFRQMDFEAAFDQLTTLISLEPHRVLVLNIRSLIMGRLSYILCVIDTHPFTTENVSSFQ